MNKEKTSQFVKDFFSSAREHPRNPNDYDDVVKLYRGINDSHDALGMEWFIEGLETIGGYADYSTVATYYDSNLGASIIIDTGVCVCDDDVEQIINGLIDIENRMIELKTKTAKLINK